MLSILLPLITITLLILAQIQTTTEKTLKFLIPLIALLILIYILDDVDIVVIAIKSVSLLNVVLLYILHRKDKMDFMPVIRKVLAAFVVVIIIVKGFTFLGILTGLLWGIGALAGTIKDPLRMKLVYVVSTSGWLALSLFQGSPGAALTELAGLISVFYAIYVIQKEKKEIIS